MNSVIDNSKPRYASAGPVAPVGADPNAPAPMVQQMVAQQQATNVFKGGNGVVGRFENNGAGTAGTEPHYASMNLPKPVVNGAGGAVGTAAEGQQAPQFQKDETKKDGGFFGWLGGLVKKRPGRRLAESDDEYDERMTRNNERIAVLADAIRHMGNIYFTSKGAAPQKFNSPIAGYEQGLQQRKAERKAQAAASADAAYKKATLQMKIDAANAERAYKAAVLGYKGRDADRADKQAENLRAYREGILGVQQGNLYLSEKRLGETQRHNRVTEGQGAARIAISQARLARGGKSGSSEGYTYATPYGRMSSAKKMTAQQQAMAWNEMKRLGMITPQKQKELDAALKGDAAGKTNATLADGIINRAVAYAMMDSSKRGDAFRKFFVDGLGYDEYRESNTPQRGVNTTGKKARTVVKTVSKAQAKKIREQRKGASPIRWQGAATTPTAQSKQASTSANDWSKYIDK